MDPGLRVQALISKTLIFVWVHLGVLGGCSPKLCQKSFVLKISTDTKKRSALAHCVKNMLFGRIHRESNLIPSDHT